MRTILLCFWFAFLSIGFFMLVTFQSIQKRKKTETELILQEKDREDWNIPAQPSIHQLKTGRYLVPSDTADDWITQAETNFELQRISYSDQPFVTVVTRTLNREKQLEYNKLQVSKLIDKDVEHVILKDRVGAGMAVAEAALYAFRNEYRGKYVLHVDDDDYICDLSLVNALKRAAKDDPPLIVIGNYHALQKRGYPLHSAGTFPREGSVTTSNVVFRRDMYQDSKHSKAVAQHWGGDYCLIHNCLVDTKPSEIVYLKHNYIFIQDREPL